MSLINRISMIRYCAIILLVLVSFSSCDTTIEPPTLEEERAMVLEDLSNGFWEATSISRESIDAGSIFPDVEMSFSDGNYTAINGKHVWKDSGSWTFVEGRSDQIIRDDNVIINVEIDGDNLTLSFEMEEDVYSSGGRSETLISLFIFKLLRRFR